MDDAERKARQERRERFLAEGHARQRAVMDDLGGRAHDALWWLGTRRQAGSYLRHLATQQQAASYAPFRPLLDGHEAALRGWVAEADRHLATLEADEVDEARSRLGARLAFIGKGGSGKTVVAATVARLLARRGQKVLAADMDRSPGLSYSIGLGGRDISLPAAVLEANDSASYGWQLKTSVLPRQAVEDHAATGPDGARLTGFGKIDGVEKEAAKMTMVALIELLLGFGEPDWHVVADLEGGPTTPFERYHAFSEDVVVVVGPAWRSAMTARRLLPMVGTGRTTTIAANRFRDEPDHRGLVPHIRIPFDPDVAQAEREGLSPLDECPGSPTVEAIERLVGTLVPPDRHRATRA
jgi:CO dehydrogenase maturation factor